jgi:hypothetical protein
METKQLLARWHVLHHQPGNAIPGRAVLEERLVILHRLNELGHYHIDSLSLIDALEQTNVLLRTTYQQN